MAATAVNARWQAEMSAFFVDDGNPDEGFVVVEEVFHLEAQLAAAGLPTAPAAPTDADVVAAAPPTPAARHPHDHQEHA